MENSPILPNIRIRKITLTNFRNIKHSEIEIPNGKITEYLAETPSVLGLYGQNGSGKTSLLMAISALKTALMGAEFFFPHFSSCVRTGCDFARLEFEFSAYNEKGTRFDIYYGFSMSIYSEDMSEDEPLNSDDDDELAEALGTYLSDNYRSKAMDYLRPKDRRIVIFDEILQCGGESETGKKQNKQVVIDTSEKACAQSERAFGNKVKYEQLTKNNSEEIHENLKRWKIEANIKSTSYIFSRKVIKSLIRGSSVASYKLVLAALSEYADNYLFVIEMDETAYNSMNVLPYSIWINGKGGAIGDTIPLSLNDHCQVSDKIFDIVAYSIMWTSNVISKIVPGLTIEIIDIGKTINEDQSEVHLFDLKSNRDGVPIPLRYESDGIKRIISFLSLIIAVYNNPSVTVAIDEIDSGIFEYMLGEILSVLGESAKGQLIFTSHNLRPLEVLPPKYLLFTTVNPDRRFAKLEGISGNNNLRDRYFRTIDLGVGKDAFYDSTDTFNIEQAMFEAGHQEEQ